jgi:hypothetical protein
MAGLSGFKVISIDYRTLPDGPYLVITLATAPRSKDEKLSLSARELQCSDAGIRLNLR